MSKLSLMSKITVFDPLTGKPSSVESNDAEQTHGVDNRGVSIGQVPLGTAFRVTPEPPGSDGWLWNFELSCWEYTPTLLEIVAQSLTEIDAAAGAARLRYLTDVPGQQTTYLIKSSEAQAWLNGSPVAGPYLQAEADAMQTDVTAAAKAITTITDRWDSCIGPAIEKARRSGKIALGKALNNVDVMTQRDAALTILTAI